MSFAGGNLEFSNESPIKILRLVARMNVGGPALQIHCLMENLPKVNFQQVLLTGCCEDGEIDYLKAKGVELENVMEIDYLGRSLDFLDDFRSFCKIRQEMKRLKPHILHTHTTKAGVIGRIASMTILHQPIRIHTYHGHLLHGYFGRLKTFVVVFIERTLALFTHALVTVGDNVRDELLEVKIGNLQKYSVIRPGLSANKLPNRNDVMSKLNINARVFTVTWIGRAVPIKAPERILEIAEECLRIGVRANFLVVGGGPLIHELQAHADSRGLDVTFLGWQLDIDAILALSDLVILTSKNEGTPISLIQAQLVGIPVLATNVGSTREVLEDGESGFCIDYSAESFAEKIHLLSTNSQLWQSMSKNALRFSNKKFSIRRFICDYSNLYNSFFT